MPHAVGTLLDSGEDLDLKGLETPPEPTTIETLRDAETIPLEAILAPRKPELKRSKRTDIARMVSEDFVNDWQARADWRVNRKELLDRYRMKPVPKTEPFEECANLRLPTIMTAAHAIQARVMASIYGNDPAIKVAGVNATGRDNKGHAETLMHWDARVRDGGDFKLLDRVSLDVVVEGGRPIYTYWDRDSRFVQDAIPVYVSDLTGDIMMDEGGIVPVDPSQPSISREDGETFTAVKKVVEHERIVYDAPRSIDIEPDDFLVPYNARGIQYPEAAHAIIVEREHFNRIKAKTRPDKDGKSRYYLTRKDIGEILQFARTGATPIEEEKTERDQSLDDIIGVQEVSTPRMAEGDIRLLRWFGRYDLNDDGIDEEVIFLVQPDTEVLVWWAYLDDIYQHGKRPIVDPRFHIQPGRYDGFGLAQILRHIDDAVNALFNIALDWGKIQNVPFFTYVPSSVEDENIKLKPGQGIPVAHSGAIEFPQTSGNIDFAIGLIQVLQQYIERVTLVSDETLGRQSDKRDTKGGILARIGEGNIGFELMNRRFLNDIKEMYTQRFQLYQQYMPEQLEITVLEGEEWTPKTLSRDMITGQYQFELEADAVSGNRLARMDLSLTLFNQLSQYVREVYPAGVIALARKVIKDSGDKDVNDILPLEVGQMIQQAQEMEAEMRKRVQEVDMEAKLALAASQRAAAMSQEEKDALEKISVGMDAELALAKLELEQIKIEATEAKSEKS